MFGRSKEDFLKLAARVQTLESELLEHRGSRLEVEQQRAQFYYERNQHLDERIRGLLADNRRLAGEVERGTQALQVALALVQVVPSEEKERILEAVRYRVSEMHKKLREKDQEKQNE
jgi:hypothetical protein